MSRQAKRKIPRAMGPVEWTPDAELEKYVASKREPFDQLGALQPYFVQRLKKSPFDLSFTRRRFRDVRQWRKHVLPELRRALALPHKRRLGNVRVLGRKECDGFVREEIEFESQPGLRVPATVLVPRHVAPPFPAIVALHDMGSFRAFGREKLIPFEGEPSYLTEFRNRCYEGKSVGLELVKRGFLVVSIDSLMFGERVPAATIDRDRFLADRLRWTADEAQTMTYAVSGNSESTAARCALLTGQTWAGMVAHDDLATVDYLVSRRDVDARRIGCVGLSYGAYRTNLLAALDERIAAAVSVCWMATLDSLIGYNVGGCIGWFSLVPGVHTRLDFSDIASLACPRPFMAISGWKDELMQPHGITSSHRKLRAAWQKAKAPHRLGSLCFDSPHEFNSAMQEKAFLWLARWLQ